MPDHVADSTGSRRAVDHPSLLSRYESQPDAISARSFAHVDAALAPLRLSGPLRQVASRLVHATGEPELASLLRMHPRALEAGIAAIRDRRPIVTDVRMVAAGLSGDCLARSGCAVHCALDGKDVPALAAERAITRAATAMQQCAGLLDGAIVTVGNAPTALMALLDLVDARVARPALIIGMPVGYVGAAESKDELMLRDVPWITLPGARGGSAHAVAIANALLHLALDDPSPAGREARPDDAIPCLPLFGLADDLFALRGPTPSLITKSEVRAVVLARMQIDAHSIVWDIGTGSGAVGIEAARLATAGRVYAVDRDPDAVAIARSNAQRLGAPAFNVLSGEAPEALDLLPDPNAVFVGGSGGRLAEILAGAARRLSPGGRLVLTCVTLEHLSLAMSALRTQGFAPDVTAVNIARSKIVGNLTRMEALNPVYIIGGVRNMEPRP